MQLSTYSRSDHHIQLDSIDPDALDVITRLQGSGFNAYLVGGGVRDLLIQRNPKDFDVATSARPEQIKAVFGKRCLLIGKRFRLAHVRYGSKIFEVATFRSGDNEDTDLIVRDNRWGSPEEDALRRDFTINGLFYDPQLDVVLDYVGGYIDIHKHTLRCIGNPIARFKQDPVRMIRLLKFRARFPFITDPDTEKALSTCLHEITKSSPARVIEEIFRMLESGSASPFFQILSEARMLDILFPCFEHFMNGPHKETAYAYLKTLDQEQQRRLVYPLDRSIALATLIYPIIEQELHTVYLKKGHTPHIGQIIELIHNIMHGIEISSFAQFSKKILSLTAYILTTQYRLTPLKHKPKINHRLFHVPDFDYALSFLKLRAIVQPECAHLFNMWKDAYNKEKASVNPDNSQNSPLPHQTMNEPR